ncbi:hypothetical protein CPU12_05215 [Malaciobacter molluscorum LMG 25693]|uniref:Flagellar rod assembly protein FlgJ n=1 Tax=Malaciobacter molluscorum LMG 25693 TaxID=870501 RepID=A0A2G1DIR5_9BACT|nr:hypothetical protein [Malaciobacter molluscorum]AXX93136.1 putative flagellar rod assembly protein FlgJ [Malaciobacter molluscorum LMG 25693]PHO18395.1 hypothetical protein CPU12_05215 [Malaciobacter molluscorum LMG 25693]RXJ95594.1 hypothetical protein CRV00_03895 [Malaciobacter molluscorum]
MIELSKPIVTYNKYDDDKLKNIDVNKLQDENLKKVSDDFESFFAQQLMDISLKSTNVAGEGAGADIIKSMYTETLSQSTQGNLGISQLLYDFLSRNNK